MSFLWPNFLWLLPGLALLPAAYVALLRRRRKTALRYSNLGAVRAAIAGRAWRQHLPPALFLLACAGLFLAAARPVARAPLPWARSTVMLVMDVSLSMRVSDVKPNRITAAQEAAKSFLRELPRSIEVGLVTFAGSTQVAQRATLDREALTASINGFQMQWGTAVGDAIVMTLAELFPEQGIDLSAMTLGRTLRGGGGGGRGGRSLDEQQKPPPRQIAPVAPGSYDSAAIILLSDGRRTTGVDTLEAAKMAADRGVRIDVVGLGVVNGDAAMPAWGLPIYMQLDEPTLREVARMTGGEYHHADTAEALHSVYRKLGSRMQVQTRETELTGLLTLASGLIAAVAALLSLLWFGRIA
jgi:Ca-activated chloride channel family protein